MYFMLKKIFVVCLGLSCVNVFAQDGKYYDSLYSDIADRFLVKDKQVENFFRIDEQGVFTYASYRDKRRNKAEFYLPWTKLKNFQDLIKYSDRNYQFLTYSTQNKGEFDKSTLTAIDILSQNHTFYSEKKNRSLDGYRIAIDPGHVATSYDDALIEQRFINIQGHDGNEYRFFEAELNLLTALMLRDSLKKLGAEVFLTRDNINTAPLGKPFKQWTQEELPKVLKRYGMDTKEANKYIRKTKKAILFNKYYLRRDIMARADQINYFKPHLSIVIHYNVDEQDTGPITSKNYSMAFVPGSYIKNELNTKLERFDFLRTLLTNHLQESSKLCLKVTEQFETLLGVPLLSSEDYPKYIKDYALKVHDGVYARNLLLCRLLNSPICYGEPLLQNNIEELKKFRIYQEGHSEPPKRIQEVANAYFYGVIGYLKEREKEKR